MATVVATPTVVNEIMADPNEALFWEMVRHHERAPYFFPEEGVNARLNKAARLVYEHRITPHVDGSYTVEGSGGRQYRVTDTCSCPQAQKGKSKWCYHHVGVVLYIEWQARQALGGQALPRPPALPLPPVTVEERLAQPPPASSVETPFVLTLPEEGLVAGHPGGTTTPVPPAAHPHAPGEEHAPMAEDPDPDIPEPEPVAVLERPTPPEPLRVTIPAEYVMTIKGKRHVLYAGLVIGAQKSGLLSLAADWTYNDAELSLAHAVATFADGRRYEDSGDATPANVTKGIASHFRRVALTRAKARCLRDALGISECSVEELAGEDKHEVPDLTRPPSTPDLKRQIWARIQVLAPEVAREDVGRWVQERTGYALEARHFPAILHALQVG